MIAWILPWAAAQDVVVPFESSLQGAIDHAPTTGSPSDYVVWIDSTSSAEALTIPSGARLTLRPLGSGPVVLRADHAALFAVADNAQLVVDGLELDCNEERCFTVASGAELEVANTTLFDGKTPGDGGMIQAVGNGTVHIRSSLLDTADADGDGGHVYSQTGQVWIEDSVLLDGSAYQGGSLRVGSAALILNRVRIESSDAAYRGGAIHGRPVSSLLITDSALRNNTAHDNGGGIYAEGDVSVQRSVLCENRGNDGGAMYWRPNSAPRTLQFRRSALIANEADDDGGVVWTFATDTQSMVFEECTFAGNQANDDGGSIYIPDNNSDPDLDVLACSFTDESDTPLHDNGEGVSSHAGSNFHPQSAGNEDDNFSGVQPTFLDPGFGGP